MHRFLLILKIHCDRVALFDGLCDGDFSVAVYWITAQIQCVSDLLCAMAPAMANAPTLPISFQLKFTVDSD